MPPEPAPLPAAELPSQPSSWTSFWKGQESTTGCPGGSPRQLRSSQSPAQREIGSSETLRRVAGALAALPPRALELAQARILASP